MKRRLHSRAIKAGLPAGTPTHIGQLLPKTQQAPSVLVYSAQQVEKPNLDTLSNTQLNADQRCWISTTGLSEVKAITELCEGFNVHPLVVEDIVNTHQRPKFEEYEHYLFMVFRRIITPADPTQAIEYEQISMIVLEQHLLLFRERDDDFFAPLLKQVESAKGRIRAAGTDHLAYAILDLTVDHYFSLIDHMDERIDTLEDLVMMGETTHSISEIQTIKRDLIQIRRSVSPLRELLSGFIRCESGLMHEKTPIYLRDVIDHTVHIIETLESYREILSGLMDIHISNTNNRMNEIMKVLTIFSTIFIPLTFITGIYGMNFDWMPELHWKGSYPLIWVGFLVIPSALWYYFHKKRWL
jgi:magnesium transporter